MRRLREEQKAARTYSVERVQSLQPHYPRDIGCLRGCANRFRRGHMTGHAHGAFHLGDFSTPTALWWDGGYCSELSLRGSDGMVPGFGAGNRVCGRIASTRDGCDG